MNILKGKGEKGRIYLLLPKKVFRQDEAVDYARKVWHCKADECILCGAERKSTGVYYVELPFEEGTHWSIYRGCKTDGECLKRFVFGGHKIAEEGV